MGKQTPEQVRQTFWRERGDVGADVQSFAEDLFRVATDRAGEIDGLIEGHAQHWRMERMAAVDRNLMRAAVAELLGFPDTPRAVVINEALEIARKFSSPESVQFINGVLDSVGKELEKSLVSRKSTVCGRQPGSARNANLDIVPDGTSEGARAHIAGLKTEDRRLTTALRLDRDQIRIAGEGHAIAQASQESRGIGGERNLQNVAAVLGVQNVHLAIGGGDVKPAAVGGKRGLDRDGIAGDGNRGRRLVVDIEHQHSCPGRWQSRRRGAVLRHDQLGGDKAALAQIEGCGGTAACGRRAAVRRPGHAEEVDPGRIHRQNAGDRGGGAGGRRVRQIDCVAAERLEETREALAEPHCWSARKSGRRCSRR